METCTLQGIYWSLQTIVPSTMVMKDVTKTTRQKVQIHQILEVRNKVHQGKGKENTLYNSFFQRN